MFQDHLQVVQLLMSNELCWGILASKEVNTVPEAVPVWLAVRYISDTGQYQCTV